MITWISKKTACFFYLACNSTFASDLVDNYRLALEHDPTYRAAQDQRDATIEALPQADAALFPLLQSQASYDNNRLHVLSSQQSGFSNLNSSAGTTSQPSTDVAKTYYTSRGYTVGISQTLFDWSAFQTVSKARIQVMQANAALRSADQSVIYRVADAYFTALLAADTLAADLGAKDAYYEQLDQAQHKYAIGYIAITDLQNATASYDTSTAAVIADQRALDTAKRALEQIVGTPVQKLTPIRTDIPLEAPNPQVKETWVENALKDNPDLQNAFYTAESARKDVDITRGRYFPTVTANAQAGRQVSHSIFGDDAINDQIGVSVNWNYSTGGLVQSEVRQTRKLYAQQQEAFEATRRNVDKQTRDAYEGVVSGIASIQASKRAIESNQTSVESNKIGLKVGTRTQVDVLTAQQTLAIAQRTFASARYDYLRSMLLLKQQTGRLSEADIVAIDNMLETSATAGVIPINADGAPTSSSVPDLLQKPNNSNKP